MVANSLLCKKDPTARRLTSEEVKKLKITSEFSDTKLIPFRYKVRKVLNNIIHFITFKAGLKKNQCKYYGHVANRESLEIRDRNRCRECGVEVTHSRELRRA